MSVDETFVAVHPRWWVSNTGGVILTGVLARRTGRRALGWLFWGAVAIHVTEAAYSYGAARRAGFTRRAGWWAAQTLAVGFPSVAALNQAIRDGRALDRPVSSAPWSS